MEDYLFSYANPEDSLVKRSLIRLIEKATGQADLKRLYIENQRARRPAESFWAAAVRSLGLNVLFDERALQALPRSGPLVVVANHPYGVLDGIVISWLIEKLRGDFVVLTNAVLWRAPEVRDYVLPIDFSATPEALAMNVNSRAAARAQLDRGGAVIVFPAGGVSTTPDRLGRYPAVDARWQPFVGQLIQRSKAAVAPIWFAGQNGRLFQIASHISLTLRLSLIFHEVKSRIGGSVPVVIGAPIAFAELSAIKDRQALADFLFARTYALGAADPARRTMGVSKRLARKLQALRLKLAA